MQNEITELRNQVRTLNRIVCLMCCLFGVFMFAGCSSASKQSVNVHTFTVCSKCIDGQLRIYISDNKRRGEWCEQILLGNSGSAWNIHSESDCQSSE
jgi:hypothetical protein